MSDDKKHRIDPAAFWARQQSSVDSAIARELMSAVNAMLVDPLEAELTAAKALVAELGALLLENEWGGCVGGSGEDMPCCMACGGINPQEMDAGNFPKERHGHAPDCRWVAVCRKAGVLPQKGSGE